MSYTYLVSSEDHVPYGATNVGDGLDIDLSVLAPGMRPTAVRIRRVMVPNVAYNVVASNQSFILTIGVDEYTITIPVGYYSRDDLIAACNTAMAMALAATTSTAVFSYNVANLCASLVVKTAGVAVAFSLDVPAAPPPRLAPTLIFMMGIDDRTLPVSYDPANPTGPIANPTPVDSDPDRFALITCLQARGLRGQISSLSLDTSVANPKYTWHNGLVSHFPLNLPKGELTWYTPDDDAQWVHLVRSEANMTLEFRLSRHKYETFGPGAIHWTMLVEINMG